MVAKELAIAVAGASDIIVAEALVDSYIKKKGFKDEGGRVRLDQQMH